MNTKRAYQVICDVLIHFDLTDRFDSELEAAAGNEDRLFRIAEAIGITKDNLRLGTAPVPDTVYKQYPLFDLLSNWNFSKLLAGRYAPFRIFGRLFGHCATDALADVPTEKEEEEMVMASVRARCDRKVLQINELFPGTYPLELPVSKFVLQTNELINFDKVYEMVDSYETVIKRFSTLFFAAIRADLTEQEACELNLLATFLEATDSVLVNRPITYSHIQEYRVHMQEEGFTQLESYVRIRRVIPFWMAREFYKDADFVAKYIARHADAKATIRRFLTKVTAYECVYTFVKDVSEHQRLQEMTEEELEEYEIDSMMSEWEDASPIYETCDPILVAKEDTEIDEKDRLIVERGERILKSVHCKYHPKEPEARNIPIRIMKRFGLSVNDCKKQSDISDAELPDFEALEEGDFE